MEALLSTVNVEVLAITAALIVLDLIFGFAGAIKNKDVQSEKLRKGLWHKAGFAGLIILAYVLQFTTRFLDLGFDVPAVDAVCVYIIVTEAVSIVENLCVLNPDITNSPLGSIFKHDEKIQQAAAERLEERRALQAKAEEEELAK